MVEIELSTDDYSEQIANMKKMLSDKDELIVRLEDRIQEMLAGILTSSNVL